MEGQNFTKKDWALFREKIVVWQEAYMDKLTKEYIELLSMDAAPSGKFWKLEKRINEDKKKAGVQVEMSRSKLISNLMLLINEEVIRLKDLEGFSDGLKETICFLVDG